MCGIVGYVGPRNATPVIYDGLKRLEYRGYDSAGIAVIQNDRVEVRIPAATAKAGTARFQVAAVSGRWSDAAEIELPVWTPATTVASSGRRAQRRANGDALSGRGSGGRLATGRPPRGPARRAAGRHGVRRMLPAQRRLRPSGPLLPGPL